MVAKSSPAILAALFQRFQRRLLDKEGQRLSMREVSANLAVKESTQPGTGAESKKPDVNALARWTNPKRMNWFIPVARVQGVAAALGATQDEVDALMMVRLKELAAHNPSHDALVCGAWVADRVARNMQRPPDEEAILAAYRHAVEPAGTLTVFGPEQLTRLSQFMQDLVQEVLRDAAEEATLSGLGPEMSDAQMRVAREVARHAGVGRSGAVNEGPPLEKPVRNVPRSVIVKEMFARLRSTRGSRPK